MEAGRASPRKRKLTALQAPAPAPAAADPPSPKAAVEDRISQLPDGVLGDIISLLPTKEGARTQIIASRWRSSPLNLDHHWLRYQDELDAVVSRVLSAHPGPGRRFCAPVYHLHGDRAATADAWLRSPALDNLQELELCSFDSRFKLPYPPKTPQPLPAAAFRFSDTLCVTIIWNCQLNDSTAQGLQFPKLKKLVLERVSITESSMHNMLAGSPALECLLIQRSSGFRCVRIKSIRLGSIGVNSTAYHSGLQFEELIIEDAPCLERLLKLGSCFGLLISVISAPKLETLGYLSCSCNSTTLAFDSTFIQGLRVNSLATTVCTVKILAVDMLALSLDVVVDLMRCFPCLEKLYIESMGPGKRNLWRRKHRDLIRSFDIRLKTIVWRYYRGIRSHVDFSTFFLLNARVLESITLQVNQKNYNEEFFAQQRKMLQLDSKASRGARLHFTPDGSHRCNTYFRVDDLDLADPFERKDPYKFCALS